MKRYRVEVEAELPHTFAVAVDAKNKIDAIAVATALVKEGSEEPSNAAWNGEVRGARAVSCMELPELPLIRLLEPNPGEDYTLTILNRDGQYLVLSQEAASELGRLLAEKGY